MNVSWEEVINQNNTTEIIYTDTTMEVMETESIGTTEANGTSTSSFDILSKTITTVISNTTLDSLTTFGSLTTEANTGPKKGPDPLGLVALLVLTFLGNALVCLAVKLERRLHTMTYYFCMSLAVVHLIMLATVMTPALLLLVRGRYPLSTLHIYESTLLWVVFQHIWKCYVDEK